MPLQHAAAPDGRPILRRFLARAIRASRGGELLPARPEITEPHPVYQIAAADIVAGAAIEEARLVAWRHFVTAGGRPVGIALLGVRPDGTSFFGGFHRGALVGSLLRTIGSAEAFDHAEPKTWEVRGFQIPGVHVVGIWLHADGHDVFLPAIAPRESRLEIGQPYVADEFFERLRGDAEIAIARRAVDSI